MSPLSKYGERHTEAPQPDDRSSVELSDTPKLPTLDTLTSARREIDERLDRALDRAASTRVDEGEDSPEFQLALAQVQMLEHARSYNSQLMQAEDRYAAVFDKKNWTEYKPTGHTPYFAALAAFASVLVSLIA